MDYEELKDLLDGLHAWDGGATSSGIFDERRKAEAITYLRSLGESERRIMMARIGRDLYLTDEKLKQGYGLEDMRGFADWLDDIGVLVTVWEPSKPD